MQIRVVGVCNRYKGNLIMFDATWDSATHKIEVAELEKRNLHIYKVQIEGHGQEEVVFQGTTRKEAEGKLKQWLKSEPFVK